MTRTDDLEFNSRIFCLELFRLEDKVSSLPRSVPYMGARPWHLIRVVHSSEFLQRIVPSQSQLQNGTWLRARDCLKSEHWRMTAFLAGISTSVLETSIIYSSQLRHSLQGSGSYSISGACTSAGTLSSWPEGLTHCSLNLFNICYLRLINLEVPRYIWGTQVQN